MRVPGSLWVSAAVRSGDPYVRGADTGRSRGDSRHPEQHYRPHRNPDGYPDPGIDLNVSAYQNSQSHSDEDGHMDPKANSHSERNLHVGAD